MVPMFERRQFKYGVVVPNMQRDQPLTWQYSISVDGQTCFREGEYNSQQAAAKAMRDEVAELNYVYGRRISDGQTTR